LQAIESLPRIKAAFKQECVDYTIQGDYEETKIAIGVRQERSTPADYPTILDKYPGLRELKQRLDEKGLFEQTNEFIEPSTIFSVKKKTKIGRNDPCSYGSGKKSKKCCLGKAKA
jgi:hypothetical protein